MNQERKELPRLRMNQDQEEEIDSDYLRASRIITEITRCKLDFVLRYYLRKVSLALDSILLNRQIQATLGLTHKALQPSVASFLTGRIS